MRLEETRFEMVDDEMARVLRAKSGAERLAIANGLFRFARRLTESAVRADHTDWDDRRVGREVARRLSHGTV